MVEAIYRLYKSHLNKTLSKNIKISNLTYLDFFFTGEELMVSFV